MKNYLTVRKGENINAEPLLLKRCVREACSAGDAIEAIETGGQKQ